MTEKKGTALERSIYSLIPELSEVRREFIKILNILLDDVEAYREILVNAGSQAEKLIMRIEELSGVRKHDISLINKIENLQNKGVLPAEIASYFHTIRVFSNKARHGDEKIKLTKRDAENMLCMLLRLYEWIYCEYDVGPKYQSIYRELPEVSSLVKRTILPSGALYCFVTPLFGFMYKWFGIENEIGFISLILLVLSLTLIDQFRRTKRFLGLRLQSELASRFRSYGALYFISLLVILNSPLLTTAYTGIDNYGFFLLFIKNSKLWAIVVSLIVNFFLASVATILFLWIAVEWVKRKPQDFVNSTFSTVLIPLGIIYFVIALTQRVGMESYFLVAFFAFAAAFIGIIGYSHPDNQLELFTAKLIFILCIVFIVIGLILAVGGMLFKLFEYSQMIPQNVFETHLWMKTFEWGKLGITPELYVEKLKLGFIWNVLTASLYLILAVGYSTVMAVYYYQLQPALKRESD